MIDAIFYSQNTSLTNSYAPFLTAGDSWLNLRRLKLIVLIHTVRIVRAFRISDEKALETISMHKFAKSSTFHLKVELLRHL